MQNMNQGKTTGCCAEFGHSEQSASDQSGQFGGGSNVGQTAKEIVHDVKQRAGEQALSLAEWLKTEGKTIVESQTSRFANKLNSFAGIMQRCVQDVQSESDPQVAGYVMKFGDRISGAADYLAQNDLSAVVRDAGRQIREHKEIAFGAFFVGGLALARFLKASAKHADKGKCEPGYPGGNHEGGNHGLFHEAGRDDIVESFSSGNEQLQVTI